MNLLGTLAFDLTNPNVLMVAGIAILLWTLMSWSARRRKRTSQVDGRASQYRELHNSRRHEQAREDIDELMVRLEELSREICGQIDTRYAKLENLLDRAERTLEALRSAAPAAPGGAGAASAPTDPKHVEIYHLWQQGLPPIDIARRLSMTVGEVELVLSLERSRRTLAGSPAGEEPAPPTGPGKGRRARKAPGFDARA